MHIDEPASSRAAVLPSFEAELFVNLIVDSGILERVFLCLMDNGSCTVGMQESPKGVGTYIRSRCW